MTIESNNFYEIAIAMLGDWLKMLYPVFQQMRSKTKTSGTLCVHFSPTLSKFQVIVGNSDWFIVLIAPVFQQLFENHLYSTKWIFT